MAKIRSIKPEFWESEQVGECQPMSRLLFICLWNFCDDAGNYPASVKAMKRNAFGYDEVSADQVATWMDELISNGLVAVYEVDGRCFWHVTGFSKHQTIARPFYKYPPFPGEALPEQCSSNVQALPEQCSSIAVKGKGKVKVTEREMYVTEMREAESVDNSKRAYHPVDNSEKQKPAANGQQVWWKSDRGIEAMARNLGIEARAGESFRALKGRCFDEINRRKGGRA